MSNRTAIRIAAVMGFLAVALGAFGAHGLEKLLQANERVETWHTAVFYHFIHTLMLYVLAQREPFRRGPWWSFFLGIVVFSGSLYLLSITNMRWLGAITPLGGVSFLAGWFWLVAAPGIKGSSSGSN